MIIFLMKGSLMKKKIYRVFLIGVISTTMLVLGYLGKIYFDIRSVVNETYEETHTSKKMNSTLNIEKPISILLLGIDNGGLNRTDSGRADTILIATINPQKKTTHLISIPRDTYTEIIGYNRKDKINHSYSYGGVKTTISTIENFLDISINYYVKLDLNGIKKLVDIVNGVEVNNPFTFSYEGSEFSIGKLHLDGELALKFSRMRYSDPEGDYGRQKRQQQIIVSLMNKLKSLDSLKNYQAILNTIGENLKTDISWELLQNNILKFKTLLKNLKTDQLKGTGFIGDGVIGENGISYQRIEPSELQRIKKLLMSELK